MISATSKGFNIRPFGGGSKDSFSPLSLSPILATDTVRMPGFDTASPILRVYRETANDTVDIYGYNPSNPRQYKTSAGGAYVTDEALLFPTEHFFVVDIDDESGNAYDANQTDNAKRLELIWLPKTLDSELITNGTFDTDTTGWTAVDGTIAVVGGELEVTPTSGGFYGKARQGPVSVTIGDYYYANSDMPYKTPGGGGAFFQVGTAPGSFAYFNFNSSYPQNFNGCFKAISTTCYMQLQTASNPDSIARYDNVSLKKVLSWDYPVVQSDGINETMSITMTHSASNYTIFARILQPNPADTVTNAIIDIGTGRIIVAYPSGANLAGYYYAGYRTATLTNTDWINLIIVLDSSGGGRILVGNTEIATGLTYSQTAIGGTIKLFSHNNGGTNFFTGRKKALLIYDYILSADEIAQLNNYYS